MISIRKRENETIIIQNFKREYLPIFSYLIGGYSILNFLSMIKVDINLSYKFFLVGFGIAFLWYSIKFYRNEKLITQVFLIVNNKEFIIKIKEMKDSKKEKSFLLNDIEKITIKNIDGLFHLVLKLKNGIEDRTIWETSYSSDLRLIRKIILEYKVKGEE
ncbi:hypothetical protein CJ209_11915 [Fusobacterium nucleatum]|uniref:Uncharacterized protein n=2 Tax=Fusobacterium TaxID=848 RepID=A0A2N6TEL5_FUSNU|nr:MULTISPECIES: hypothetical protein [Fusobacterium]EGN63209.1 hypothetical protein HMPREF0401_00570 [Fusobacterium animalis 11_3_2]PMC67706.1 hypothetical protein CJ209_11915 [Fusobacterium nucleatum]QYR63004.1 hypothetical protein JY398_08615 [Fusobacterium animalis]QYR68448.1 hypothetical protein JY401_03615 [Fusobacterium animalis]